MVAFSAALSSGCSLFNDAAAATWDLAKDQTLDSATTAFAVDVTRLGCNSGETGTVNDPDIEVTDTQVVITFTVSPGEPTSVRGHPDPADLGPTLCAPILRCWGLESCA
jgi:hypothetical protein